MELYFIVSAFVLSFIIVIITVPPILRVAKAKQLFEPKNERKIHIGVIPPLGGVGIFLGFTLATIVVSNGFPFDVLKYILAAVIMMFFIGLKDDLMAISPRKKFGIQILAALILVILGNVHFTNLHGVFGIYEISEYVGIPLTLLAIIGITNAFNLIDGIDGLASGISMMGSFVFGVWFYINGYYDMAIMALALTGSLSAFFLYNVFGNKNKLFMGDAGSLIIGIVMSILVIQFNELNLVTPPPYAVGGAPAVSFAIIMLPLIDTFRVMAIRIFNGRSPFSPDTNHLHHRLLVLNPTHLVVTVIIVTGNILIIALSLIMNHNLLNVNIQLLIVLFTGMVFSTLPTYVLKVMKKDVSLKSMIEKAA